ncbi:MAG: hypothetical protein J6X55_15005 [Victivallales bacterium]|nr:hypothetical protein [Victivallales bacterium]
MLFEQTLQDIGLDGVFKASMQIKSIRSIGDAEVYRYDLPNGKAVLLKTYRKSSWIVRKLIGQRALCREHDNLNLFHTMGIVRVPEPYGIIDNDTIACEFLIEAETLQSAKRYDESTMPSRAFFRKLIDAIRQMHEHGICHGDLRRGNLMIDKLGNLYVIDIATAICASIETNPLKRLICKILMKSDDYSLAKIVNSYYPDLLDEELAATLHNPPWYLKLGQFLRHDIYRKLRLTHKHKRQ